MGGTSQTQSEGNQVKKRGFLPGFPPSLWVPKVEWSKAVNHWRLPRGGTRSLSVVVVGWLQARSGR